MKNVSILLFLFIFSILSAEELFDFSIESVEGVHGAVKAAPEEDPTINASTATLEGTPSGIVAGCVNVMTGSYFDSGVGMALPGAQPLVVQHTFCGFLDCHFSHYPSLDVNQSPNGHHLYALYTDDNGSGIPYKANSRYKFFGVTEKATYHLTNGGSEISGRTKWTNSSVQFVQNGKKKNYHLVFGSGVRRIFELYKKVGKTHKSGAPCGKFRLKEEHSLNGNKYLYKYNNHDTLESVKATNKNGALLAELKCRGSGTGSHTVFSVGNMGVVYDTNPFSLSLSILPSHGIPVRYERDKSMFSLTKYQGEKRLLKASFSKSNLLLKGAIHGGNPSLVKTLWAPVGDTESLIPIYRFEYEQKNAIGYTTVKNAFDWKVKYKYHATHKRLLSKLTYDKNGKPCCKENFYWKRTEPPPLRDLKAFASYIQSEYLLSSHTFKEGKHYCFCRHLEYDGFGNVTKNHLWGNLTGKNHQPIVLKEGVPLQNGCEVYTKTMEASQDRLNLPLYEDDGRKSIRQTYYSDSNLIKTRFTEAGHRILKREYFRYDENGTLIEEIWDDGCCKEKRNLTGVTERHQRITIPRKEFPVGLPEIIQEFCFNMHKGTPHLVKQLVNTHSPEGRVLSQKHYGSDGALAYTLYWTYDRLGNVIEEIDAMGRTITRTFDEQGNKRTEQGARKDLHTIFDYDYNNRLIKQEERWQTGERFVTTHRYNHLNQKIATIDSQGNETLFFYDRLGYLSKTVMPTVQSPSGWVTPTTRTRYNTMGQAVSICDANGESIKKQYTVRGQPYAIHFPDGSTELKEYSLDGLLVKEVEKNGLTTHYTHDPFGRVIRTEKFNLQGVLLSTTSATYSTFHLLSETDEAGVVTTYQYDSAGRCLSLTKEDKTTTYSYDPLGRQVTKTEGDITHVKEYDLLDRVIEERTEIPGTILTKKQYQYDESGNRTHEIIDTQAGIAVKTTNYNPHGQPIKSIDSLGQTTHFTYEIVTHHGQRVRREIQTDPLGNQKIILYDSHHRIGEIHRQNPFGKRIQSEYRLYDPTGRNVQTTLEVYVNDIKTSTLITEWEYDKMGNNVRCTEAKGTHNEKHSRYTYNSHGEKEQLIKPDGTILFHQYDILGRLTRLTSSDDTVDYVYIYDVKDALIQVNDLIHGTSTIRSYDKHNRLLSETLATGFVFSYTYDTQDRPLTITLPDQSTIQYSYHGHFLSRVDRIKENQIIYTHHYTEYDQGENLLKMELPGEAGVVEYIHDLLQRVISLKAPHWQETIPANGYDAAGNLLRREVTDAQGQRHYFYTYDDLYQLRSEKGHRDSTYTHDSLYNRVDKNNQPYKVNELNQLLEQTTTLYAYDLNGNCISIQEGNSTTTFNYDALDRLVQVNKNGIITHYQYDSFHRRLTKTQTEGLTHYLYLKDNEIGAVRNHSIYELRILGAGKGAEIGAAIAIELENQIYIPLHDPQGNVVTLLDLQGKMVNSYRYTAFGEEEINGTVPNPWRYSSKRVDPETGFLYFGQRYYQPSVGRWLTPDPLGFADGPNLYAYVRNRPLTHIDPDGQFAFLIPIAISLAIDLCLPTATAYLAEYAGGAVATSLLTGLASGYNDPVSSVFSADTYSIGTADPFSFACNRAGMALGTLLACRPTTAAKNGTAAVVNIAGRELAGAAITKAETVITRSITTNIAKSTAQKTSLTAERYIVKGGLPLSRGAENINAGVLLRRKLISQEIAGGHAFSKHASEFGFQNRGQMASHIENVLTTPTKVSQLSNGRTAFWHSTSGSVVVRNPTAVDGGTVFIPRNGLNYFLNELK